MAFAPSDSSLLPPLHAGRLADLGLLPREQCLQQPETLVQNATRRLNVQYDTQEAACKRLEALAASDDQSPFVPEDLPDAFVKQTQDEEFDADACFAGVYTRAQMRLLAEHLHRRGLVDRERVAALDADDSVRGICALLARYFSPSSALEVEQTFAALDCQYFSGVPDNDLLALAEWLQRDGLVDKQINLASLGGKRLCEIVTEAYVSETTARFADQGWRLKSEEEKESKVGPITSESSYAARRLDSLLTIAEPVIADIPVLRTAREELAAHKELWPEPRALDRDVRAMCREFFQRKVKRVPRKEHQDRIALLNELASIFYNENDLKEAISPQTDALKKAPKTTPKQLAKAEEVVAEKVHQMVMSRYGERVVRGTEGTELLETARLCLLLSHPVIRRTMERVGKVAHLTDDVIARLRAEEKRVAKEYAVEQAEKSKNASGQPAKEETMSEWLWRKASAALSTLGTMPSWDTRKAFLLRALLLSTAFVPKVAATSVGETSDLVQTSGGVGLEPVRPVEALAFAPSVPAQVGGDRQEEEETLTPELRTTMPPTTQRTDVQRTGERDPRKAGRVGFPLPKDMSLEEFRDKVQAAINVQDIIDQFDDLDDRATQVKQNLCSWMFNGNFVPSTGECKLTREASVFNLPDIRRPEKTESYRALQEFFGDWFKSELFESKAGARVQVVTPSGLPLEFLLDAERNYATAKVLGVLTPTLFALGSPRDTKFYVMPGGEILLPKNERARNQIAFYPTEQGKSFDVLRDVEWATRLCSDMMKTTKEAEDAVKVLLLAPEQGETKEAFEEREKTISALLDRCSADIADTAGFLALCPLDGSDMPLECKLQLERLEKRLIADFKNAEQRTSEHMRYERFVDAVMIEQHAVTLEPPTLQSELWGTSSSPDVRAWLQRRWKQEYKLVVPLPDGLSEEERARREDLFLRLVEAITLKAHWFDRLVNFFSNISAVSATAAAVAATLVAVYLRYGRQERGQWQEDRGRRTGRDDSREGDARTASRGKSPGRGARGGVRRRQQAYDDDEEEEEDEDYLENLLVLFRGTLPSRNYKSALRNWALFRQLQTPERSTDWDNYLGRTNFAVVTDWLVKRYPQEAAGFVRGDHKRFL